MQAKNKQRGVHVRGGRASATKEWARRTYCERGDKTISYHLGYDPLLALCGEVVLREDDGGYQGDTFAVVRADDRVGFVSISWGSCSGCDALYACRTIDDVLALANQILDSVEWFESGPEMVRWLLDADERVEPWRDSESMRRVREAAEEMWPWVP